MNKSQLVQIVQEGQPTRVAIISDDGSMHELLVKDAVTLDRSMREAIDRLNSLQKYKGEKK